ncbi:hypothetical protein LR48_Vigan05g010400 [Vigna angularis]|uniref:Uncharacterized protein n=1 Tax=Phaseolus angularis TaxID=3914 RepID=A0A0L9UHZ5_PHAAN|nr:hypothetical protein LR48_Vigan05g010400 [Vigna angularis]
MVVAMEVARDGCHGSLQERLHGGMVTLDDLYCDVCNLPFQVQSFLPATLTTLRTNITTDEKDSEFSLRTHAPRVGCAWSQERTVEGKLTYRFQNSKLFGSGESSRRQGYFYGA